MIESLFLLTCFHRSVSIMFASFDLFNTSRRSTRFDKSPSKSFLLWFAHLLDYSLCSLLTCLCLKISCFQCFCQTMRPSLALLVVELFMTAQSRTQSLISAHRNVRHARCEKAMMQAAALETAQIQQFSVGES